MPDTIAPRIVTCVAELEALYGQPNEAATVKEVAHITPHYRAYIAAAPFCALATSGPEGLDCSPRGDKPGFVRVHDEKTLMLPDRRGNNRIDSLRNIVRDPSAPVPDPGRRQHAPSQRPRPSQRRAVAARHVRGRQQAAALGDGDGGRCHLLPVRPPWCAPSCGTPRSTSIPNRCPAPARSWRHSATIAAAARVMTANGQAAPPRPSGDRPRAPSSV
jgi:hypothetical protein